MEVYVLLVLQLPFHYHRRSISRNSLW